MDNPKKLTDEELDTMFQLVKRYTTTEMDQWDLWKFDTTFGKVYFSLTREVPDSEKEAYTDINHLVKNNKF